jgi:gliding motility-associated-like protein
VSGFTYEFTISTYTKVSGVSGDADRSRLEIVWGDGTRDSLERSSQTFLSADIKQNKYIGLHTYSGPFTYVVGVTDPNRIDLIINISNSVNTLFYLEDTVKILDPNIIGYNSSPQLLNPPIEYGNVDQRFVHNPNAYDPDGDSLHFSIIAPMQGPGLPVNGYTPPNLINPGPDNVLTINPNTGELVWEYPQRQGIYNIAILIREYRNGILIGTVIRDLQIIIEATNNRPPVVNVQTQYCIVAGDSITIPVTATDPDVGQTVTLSANGSPLSISPSPATFVAGPPANPVAGLFRWRTVCDHLNKNDYQVLFKGDDNFDGPPLTDIKTVLIKVLAPPPANPSAVLNAAARTVRLEWDSLYSCSNNPKFLNFSIWRKKGCDIPLDTCNTDLATQGYQRIGTTSIYTFIDNTVTPGNQYSYRIVAEFGDRSVANLILNPFRGLASEELCVDFPSTIPVIYNVDVRTTSTTTGEIYVEWSRPFAAKLDTLLNPGPYKFILYRATGINGTNFTEVKNVSFPTFSSINDTSFLDTGLNTEDNPYTYKLAFYVRGNDSIGTTDPASSVFLSVDPAFEQLNLSWNFSVPWANTSYVIFRKLPGGSTFDSLTTVTQPFYTDSGLQNDSLYCYKIKAIGTYGLPGLKTPLINFSQEDCATPNDTLSPCAPVLSVDNFCLNEQLDTSEFRNYLTWEFANDCDLDNITKVRILYKENAVDPFVQIDSVMGTVFNFYTHILPGRSLTGCYTLQAVAKSKKTANSNVVCVDNCPVYELPNAFTPNGDGQNDLYTPIKPYRFVERIDLKVYNRWGVLVFETTDPDIIWDGTDFKNGKNLNTAVYYYICDVYFQTVNGVQKLSKPLSGYIHLFRE